MNKIRVLQVFGEMMLGGAESRMMDVYKNIDREKYQFDFLTFSTNPQYFDEEINNLGGKVIKIESPRDVNLFNLLNKIIKILKQEKYDAIHAHVSYFSGFVMLAACIAGVKIRITHARTTKSSNNGLKNNILIKLGKLLIKLFANRIIAISEEAGKFLFGNNFTIIPNSIDLSKYDNININEINKLKNEFNISDNDFVIGQIGRFYPMKNHIWTIKWFKDFLNVKPNSKLMFVGDGPLRKEIENKCKDLGIFDHVIFTGIRDDVNILINLFNVLIFPSLFEGFGAVILESQASGVPCVKSDTIPNFTDLGLDLVRSVSLNDSYDKWHKAILDTKNIVIPSKKEINEAFEKNNFTLNSTIKRYCEIYNGAK